MTRRIFNDSVSSDCVSFRQLHDGNYWSQEYVAPAGNKCSKSWRHKCRYGQPGDRLWVRETWAKCCHSHGCSGIYFKTDDLKGAKIEKWKPSIHMPRRISRITLEVINVRVERLQDISEDDAMAEGAHPFPFMDRMFDPETRKMVVDADFHRPRFKTLWDSINSKRGFGWDVNPWVWVIEFRRVK